MRWDGMRCVGYWNGKRLKRGGHSLSQVSRHRAVKVGQNVDCRWVRGMQRGMRVFEWVAMCGGVVAMVGVWVVQVVG